MPAFDSIDGQTIPSQPGTRSALLVSVRSAQELADALATGVDILDLKEPDQGPLAPVSTELWQDAASILDAYPQPRPWLSAALGEAGQAVRVARWLPESFAFAKAGPSGCGSVRQIETLWSEVRYELNDATRLVAVAYADYEVAGCLPPQRIFQCAVECGIPFCLIDTFQKDGRSTLDHLGFDRLRELEATAEGNTLWWALAGSMRAGDVTRLSDHGVIPNCFGVRGDVCENDRTGRLSPMRIANWKSALAFTRPTRAPSG